MQTSSPVVIRNMRKITIKIYWFLACMLALTGVSCKEEPALEVYADDVSQLNGFPKGLPEVASDIQYVCFAGGLQYMEEFVIFNFKEESEISVWVNKLIETGAKMEKITENAEMCLASPFSNASLSESWKKQWQPHAITKGYLLNCSTFDVSHYIYIDLLNFKCYIYILH